MSGELGCLLCTARICMAALSARPERGERTKVSARVQHYKLLLGGLDCISAVACHILEEPRK